MPKEHGVVVYEIHLNGCLNGVYADTNRFLNNDIFNEILRKKSTDISPGLSGNYIGACTDVGDTILHYDVEIRDKNGKIQMGWIADGVKLYEGTGWKTRENQLTVSYRKI